MPHNTPRDWTPAVVLQDFQPLVIQKDRLKQLPDEILLQIAGELCGSRDVSSLSRANKHIHTIASAAMAKKLVVHESKLKKALEWLAKYPKLMNSVNAVEVIGPQRITPRSLEEPGARVDDEVEKVLSDTVLANTNDTFTWERIKFCCSRPLARRYYLELLLVLCQHIKAVTLELQVVNPFEEIIPRLLLNFSNPDLPMVNPDFIPATPFHNAALPILQAKLESLTISQHRGWAGPVQQEMLSQEIHTSARRVGRAPITLWGFKRLRHLDVPMDILGLPHSILFQLPGENEDLAWIATSAQAHESTNTRIMDFPAKIIPLTLETLQLRACTSTTFVLLQIMSLIPAHKSRFKHIHLYFTTCAREFLNLCREAGYAMPDFIETLTKLEEMGINVIFLSGKEEKPVDMRKELTVMNSLVPAEIGVLPSTRRQFSSLNECAVQRRKSSRLEHRLFMKHAVAYFELLNGPSFAADSWKQIALFNGAHTFKHIPETSILTNSPRGATHPLPKRRSLGFLDLETFKFTVRKAIPNTPKIVSASGTKIWDLALTAHRVRVEYALLLVARWMALESTGGKKTAEVRNSKLRLRVTQADIGQERMGCYDLIKLELPGEETGCFLKEEWMGVEWKKHLQPRVEREVGVESKKYSLRVIR